MSESNKIIFRALSESQKKSFKTKASAIKALKDAGILTKNGKFSKPYKNLCIQPKPTF